MDPASYVECVLPIDLSVGSEAECCRGLPCLLLPERRSLAICVAALDG